MKNIKDIHQSQNVEKKGTYLFNMNTFVHNKQIEIISFALKMRSLCFGFPFWSPCQNTWNACAKKLLSILDHHGTCIQNLVRLGVLSSKLWCYKVLTNVFKWDKTLCYITFEKQPHYQFLRKVDRNDTKDQKICNFNILSSIDLISQKCVLFALV